jgi:hypothetical protein
MHTKLFEIITVVFDVADQQLIFLPFVNAGEMIRLHQLFREFKKAYESVMKVKGKVVPVLN